MTNIKSTTIMNTQEKKSDSLNTGKHTYIYRVTSSKPLDMNKLKSIIEGEMPAPKEKVCISCYRADK